MLENINKKIYEIEEKLKKREKAYAELKQKEQELTEKQIRKKEIRNILNKKERQIRRLESPGIIDLIFKRKGIDLQEELRQYDIIKSEYEDCGNSIINIEKDINFYKEQIDNYHSLDSDYDDLVKKRRNLILSKNDTRAHGLRDCLDKISEREQNIKNAKESILACDRALSSLERAVKSLESARGWGMWDIAGGGFLATAAKHSRINDMRREIKNAEKEISALNASLSRVNLPSNIDVEIGAFATFADYFFDGLVADLFVQSKIRGSLNKLRDTYDKINRIQSALQTRLGDLNRELRNLRDKADNLERNI